MLPTDQWPMLIVLAVGVVVLFTAVIVFGLRLATRRQARTLHETSATSVLAALGAENADRAALLYGMWQTSLNEVTLIVRDGNDVEVARIVHRLAGAIITTGDERYAIVTTSGWRESAMLTHANDPAHAATPLATFERRGGFGGLASYSLPDARVLCLRVRWSLSLKRMPQVIQQDGRAIGQLFTLGGPAYNDGRAVLLPPSIPLPVRLFILYKAAGA